MIAPILTIRSNIAPYPQLTTPIIYSETVAIETGLPVLSGDYTTGIVSSDTITFRIYNNFNTPPTANVSTAYNVYLTTFDGSTVVSHTNLNSAVAQCWTWFQENGFGENSSTNVLYTYYTDTGEYVGGSASVKVPTLGSDGSVNPWIRATSGSGVGMIEFTTKISPSLFGITSTYSFALSINYDWST